jgi:PAS domain S-box-containing protein
MLPFFRSLFDTDFMPHLYCLRGEQGVLWLQVISDLLTVVSFVAIPIALIRLMLLRKDRSYRVVAGLFALFIGACGLTHLLDIWTLWVPMYRLQGLAKAILALLAVTTTLVLLRMLAYLSRVPSAAQLESDIRKRKEAMEREHEKDERFRALVESVADYAICMLNPEGIVLTWNQGAERLTGYTAEEMVGEGFSRFYTEADQAAGKSAEVLRTVQETGRFDGELWQVRKDGSRFLAHGVLRPLFKPSGERIGYSNVIRDLTQSLTMEAHYRTLLEGAPDAIIIVNRAGAVVFINSQTERVFGYGRDELLGTSILNLVPEHARQRQADYMEALFERASANPNVELKLTADAPAEFFGVRKDGMDFPLDFSVSPLDTIDGRLLLFAVRDLTEKRRSEARFRGLLNSAPDAMVISGPGGLIELTNREAERLFGYTSEEMVGQPVAMLIPEDLRGGYRADSEQFLHGGLPGDMREAMTRSMGAGLDLRARRKDGSEVPVEISFSPLEGPTGVSITAAIRDMTERKRTEARFRMLLDSAPDAMVIVNSEGLIVLSNAKTEGIFGYTPVELVGQPVEILMAPSLRVGHRGHRAQFAAGPRKREMGAGLDLLAQRKDGSMFPVEISLSPLEGPDGMSVTAAIRDVTDRVAAARQLAEKVTELRQSNEALEQFAHIASHDLQEPLRMVASYVQLISKRYKGKLDADADEFIGFAVDGTQRMKRLIEDLLVYSRAGRGVLSCAPVQSDHALQEALYNLRASIEESGAEVTYEALPMIATGELQLVQLFQNLVGNAIKYRGERAPRIHVSAQKQGAPEGDEWVFSVADNGIGIEPQYFERVFVIFQRLHGLGEYEGTGIGLAICKRVLQQQGGRIWVESEPGQGSVFHFALPVR